MKRKAEKGETMKSESGRMKGDFKERTKEFALNIIGLYSQLPKEERLKSSVTSY